MVPKVFVRHFRRYCISVDMNIIMIKDTLSPGTRYRTQSEKDPHYQRRMRLRRRQIESSDEGSR